VANCYPHNHMHFRLQSFLEGCIHVSATRPMTTSLEDAQELAKLVETRAAVCSDHNIPATRDPVTQEPMAQSAIRAKFQIIQGNTLQGTGSPKATEGNCQKASGWRTASQTIRYRCCWGISEPRLSSAGYRYRPGKQNEKLAAGPHNFVF